jgi:hypothetical protein
MVHGDVRIMDKKTETYSDMTKINITRMFELKSLRKCTLDKRKTKLMHSFDQRPLVF